MVAKARGLGKGLDALFGDNAVDKSPKKEAAPVKEEKAVGGEQMIKITKIVPNPDQPRKEFDKAALQELADSIKEFGVIQPLIVKKAGENYLIIAGERRWRAAQIAGLKELPVIVREYDDKLAAEIAIIENLQREDLNPIEEAEAYAQLMNNFDMSQEEVAQRVSKNRTTITNSLRLLRLDADIRRMLIEGAISSGHGRALLALEDKAKQKELAEKIVQAKLSVRETEKLVKKATADKKPAKKKVEIDTGDYSIFYEEYENRMKSILGTKVKINRKDKEKGKIEIEYYSLPELDRLMELLESLN